MSTIRDVASNGAEAAFFDLDKTIIAKSSALAFGRPFYSSGLIDRRAVLKSAYAQFMFSLQGADAAQMDKMRDSMAKMCKGWDVAQVTQIVDETLHDLIDPIVYAEAVDLIELHRAAGHDVVIVSSSGAEVVGPIGKLLGVDHVIATQMEVVDGRVHRNDRVLRLRPEQGGRDHRPGRGPRVRPRRELRLLRLDHRPPDARARRPPERGEPRPRAAQDRRRTALADQRLPQAGPATRPNPGVSPRRRSPSTAGAAVGIAAGAAVGAALLVRRRRQL